MRLLPKAFYVELQGSTVSTRRLDRALLSSLRKFQWQPNMSTVTVLHLYYHSMGASNVGMERSLICWHQHIHWLHSHLISMRHWDRTVLKMVLWPEGISRNSKTIDISDICPTILRSWNLHSPYYLRLTAQRSYMVSTGVQDYICLGSPGVHVMSCG